MTTAPSPRIKFFCRSFDLRLYRLSSAFYRSLGYPCVRLTDQSADGYFYTILADQECDIAINVDEDCFLIDPQAVLRLVDYVVAHGYANAGCPDAGPGVPRSGNPLITNPFFNILDLRLIRTRFSRDAVRRFRYADHRDAMIAAFPLTLPEGTYTFGRPAVIEPYYDFFLYLAATFPTLYLPAERHADGTSTCLYDPAGHLLCTHSWFARFYSTPSFVVRFFQPNAGKQQARIDALIRESAQAYRYPDTTKQTDNQQVKDTPSAIPSPVPLPLPLETRLDTLRFAADKLLRWTIKIPQRIAAWPAKYRRYHPKSND